MVNKRTKARIKCKENYVLRWLSMGFEVEEIIMPDEPKNLCT